MPQSVLVDVSLSVAKLDRFDFFFSKAHLLGPEEEQHRELFPTSLKTKLALAAKIGTIFCPSVRPFRLSVTLCVRSFLRLTYLDLKKNSIVNLDQKTMDKIDSLHSNVELLVDLQGILKLCTTSTAPTPTTPTTQVPPGSIPIAPTAVPACQPPGHVSARLSAALRRCRRIPCVRPSHRLA